MIVPAERLYRALGALDDCGSDDPLIQQAYVDVELVVRDLEWRTPAGLNEHQELQARFDAVGLNVGPADRGASPTYLARVQQLKRMQAQGWWPE